jgi:L-lactate dehydrogenase complex protein LldG
MLAAVRRGLRRGPLPPDRVAELQAHLAAHPRRLIPQRSLISHAARLDLLEANVVREFGTLARIGGLADVPGAVADYLAGQNLPPEIVVGPHPELREIDWGERPLLAWREGRAEASDAVSVQHCFAGIAETGTLMFPSGPDRPTTLNLLVETEIAVLRASRVVGPYEDAWDMLREAGAMPRNVMLVTGPSRSADIEQSLELGAHGPRRLHVLLIEDA